MRYLHLLIFILIIGCNNVNEDKLRIVFLGDSITEAGVYDKEVGVEYNGELVNPDYTGFITFLSLLFFGHSSITITMSESKPF